MKNRLVAIDILRVISVLSVTYAHLISAPLRGEAFTEILSSKYPGPIVEPSPDHWAQGLDTFLLTLAGTSAGGFGVAMFFVISGYLMAGMSQRYTRKNFAINRFIRIFPLMYLALIFIGVFSYLTVGQTFSPMSYLASFTLTYQVFSLPPITVVLWTLVIEMLFYISIVIMGRVSIKRLMILQCLLLAITLASKGAEHGSSLQILAWHSKFLMVISVGSIIYLAKSRTIQISWVLLSYLMAFIALDSSGTAFFGKAALLAVLAIWIANWYASTYTIKLWAPVKILADMAYPLYLLHLPVGIIVQMRVFDATADTGLSIIAGLLAAMVISYIANLYIENPLVRLSKRLSGRRQWPINAQLPAFKP